MANPFDQFDAAPAQANAFDQFDVPARPAIPNAPLGEPERSLTDYLGDAGTRVRQGLNDVVGGLVGAPVNIANIPGTLARSYIDLAQRAGADIPQAALDMVAPIQQPAAVQGIRESLAINNAELGADLSPTAQRQAQEFQQTEGFLPSVEYLLDNPSYAGTEFAAQIPQFLQIVPGSLPGTIAAQGVGAAAQNTQQAEDVLRADGLDEATIAERGADAFGPSLAINTALPYLIPGGASIERVLAGQAGKGIAREGAGRVGQLVASTLGETGTEAVQEGADQAIQNIATGRPVMEGVGQNAALGALIGGPGGLAAGTTEALAARAPAAAVRPAAEQAPSTAIDPAILAAGNAALGPNPELHPAQTRAPLDAQPGMLASPGQAEPTDDLDALLAANLPPEAVQQAQAALGSPNQQAAALATLGDLMGEPADPDAAFRRPDPAPAVATPAPPATEPRASLPAQDFVSELAARMRVSAQEQAARTAAPAAQSPAAPVGSRPAGGDFAAPAKVRAAKPATARKPMDLLRVLAANGGLNRESFRAQGVDPAEFTRRAGFQYLFRKQGGMTPSDLREFMQQEGYLPADREDGTPSVDDNDAFDLFDRALRSGEEVFSMDQGDAVAAARFERHAEAEREWEAEFGAQHPDVAPEDYATAATVADIAERARAAGVDEFDIAPFVDEADTDYIARLEREIDQQEARRGTDNRADEADRGERVRGQAAGAEQDFALAAAEPPARQEVAPSQGAGLFGAPTTRDFTDDAQRRKDAARDGKTGTGRTDMAAGDGELFAGRRPEQADAPLESTEAFYSALAKSIETAKGAPKRGTYGQWKGWLDGAVRRGEFKQSERDWLGIDDFIKSQGDVTKQQLADFVRENQVRVEDVTLGDGEGRYTVEESNGEWVVVREDGEITDDAFPTEAEAQRVADQHNKDGLPNGTKFASYQLPGGSNYRELLLTLPENVREVVQVFGAFPAQFDTQDKAQKYLDELVASSEKPGMEWMAESLKRHPASIGKNIGTEKAGDNFKSNHFDQPNILAHVRFNERTDADGKKVLFLEEIQSDWHQQGRRNGYKGKLPDAAKIAAANRSFNESAARGENAGDWRRANPEHAAVLNAGFAADQGGGRVPNAPFKATDEWAMLAFKRMVRWAADNGFDSIGWTTGAQQAERYDLSKAIDEIHWSPNSATGEKTVVSIWLKDNGEHNVFVRKSDGVITRATGQFSSFDGKTLDEVIGKELAEKVLASPKGQLSGDGLKVGGEGMRAFYDKILPAAVNKWAKRFGGKVGEANIDAGDLRGATISNGPSGFRVTFPDGRTQPVGSFEEGMAVGRAVSVHSLPLTPAMREAALSGLPLFNTEQAQELDDSQITDDERAAFARQSVDRAGLRAKASQQNGERDADANNLRDAVTKAVGGASVQIEYLRGMDGLPERTRRLLADRARERGTAQRTSGLYVPGKPPRVFLFTDVVTTPETAAFTAAHEIAGHHGLRALLGDGLNHALEIALQNPTVAAVADSMAKRRKSSDRLLMAEEALADLAAVARTGNYAEIEARHGVKVPLAMRSRLVAAIDNFIRRVKALFGKRGAAFTDAQVRELLENAWRAAKGEGATVGGMAENTEDRLAGTKVVDANGSPLLVFHSGKEKIDRFDATKTVDGGFHFGTAEQSRMRAGRRGETVAAFLDIRNPRRSKDTGGNWKAKIAGAKAAGHDGIVYLNRYEGMTTERIAALEASGQLDKLDRMSDAEFRRAVPEARDSYIAFDDSQIIRQPSATANNGNFDASNPSILESVEDARDTAEARRNEAAGTLPVARGAAGWAYDGSKWVGRKGRASEARANLQDKMIAWRDVQGQIESQLQQAIPDAQNVYRLENLMHGRVGEGIDKIERGEVMPVMEALRAAKAKPETLEEYMYARHAPERNAAIAKINPSMPDGGSGMTNAEAAAIMAKADTATLEPIAKLADKITRNTRKRLLANGLITQEAFDAMEAQYEHYVPLRGKQVAEDADFGGPGMAGRGLDSRGKMVREALGRGAGNRASDILAEIIGDAERSVILAEKARVGRAVMRIVLANPNPDLWMVEPVQTERALDANGEVYEKVVNDWSDPSVVAVRHKGQLYKVQINSVPLAKALNHVGVDKLSGITRMAGAVNRYFSAILTKYNPAFTPVNATRDALFGLTGMAAEHGELAALDAALHYPQAAAAAFQQARGKKLAGEWGQWADEFAANGGKTGYVNMPSTEDIARKIGSGKLTGYSPDGMRKAARAIGEAVGTLNDAVENALRLSAFVTLRKRGQSAEAAAAYAKDLTVNFNRKGFDGSAWNAWFLFYNASLQGAHRTSRLLRKPKTYAYLGMLAGAQVLATMAAMGMKDDNDEPLWNKVPDHVKRRNIVIVTGDGGLITIPMPYGFNLLPYVAGRITEAALNGQRGEKRAGDRAAQLVADTMSAAIESFSPVPLDDGVAGLLPTVLRIPANVWANKNDFGSRIRNEAPYAKSDVPRASMGKPDTLEVFKLTAKGLNRVGGGDDLTPPPLSMFDVAPEDLEYLLGELTGGPGNLLVDMATSWQKATGGDYAQDLDPRDIPIAKRFRSNIDEQAAQQALFYDRREVIDRSLKRVRRAFKAEGVEAAEALLKATPELKGAAFKRRKGKGRHGEAPGSIIVTDGSPQIIAVEGDPQMPPPNVYAAYKRAEKAISARNDSVDSAFTTAPASILPTAETRQRDAFIRTENRIRQAAQSEFNAAWVRDVVGSAE